MLAIVTRATASFRDRSRGWVSNRGAALCALVGIAGACGFPGYRYRDNAGSAGEAEAGAAGGLATSGATSDAAGNGTMAAGASGSVPVAGGLGGSHAAGGVPGDGAAGEGTSGDHSGGGGSSGGGASGSSGAGCSSDLGDEASNAEPAHCANGSKDGDETGLDCGGSCSPCMHTETCKTNTDCISGLCTPAQLCAPLVELDSQTIIDTRATYTLQFRLHLKYLRPLDRMQLKDVTLRYYFARGDAAEPMVTYPGQATYNDISVTDEAHWSIQRVLVDPNTLTDAYLEVTFPNSKKMLLQGDVVDVTQSIQAASAPNHLFDQLTHYSFRSSKDLSASERVTAYRAGHLIWGTPPAYGVPEECFATAVNFGGQAITAGDQSYLAGTDPSVLFSGSTVHDTLTAFPTPDVGFVPLVQTAVVLDTAHAVLRVPNGPYWVYPYLISADGRNQGDLTLQGDDVVTFVASTVNGMSAWARLGPYRVTVSNGGLDFGSINGTVRVAGAELYKVAQ